MPDIQVHLILVFLDCKLIWTDDFKLNRIKRDIVIVLLLIITSSCKSKNVVDELPIKKNYTFYHGIELTGGDIPVRVYKWNTDGYDSIMNSERFNLLIKEVIDDNNRVRRIEFLRKGEPTDFYDFPISKVTYDYEKDKIIETLFDTDGQTLFVDKHVSHYRSIYYLDANNYIKNVARESDLVTRDSVYAELAGSPTPVEELEQDVKNFHEQYFKNKPLEVEFYKYSYYKMNGIYPVSKDFVIDSSNYSYILKNTKFIKGKRVSDTIYRPSLIEDGIKNGFKKLKDHN